MKLTYSQIDEINSAYLNLPFKENATLDAAVNITKLKPILDTILTYKSKLIKKHADGKETIGSDHKNWSKFITEFNQTLTKEEEVPELIKLKKIDIDFQNPPQEAGGRKTNLQGPISVLLSKGLLE